MIRNILIIIVAIILAAAVSTGCKDPLLPVFETSETEEDGICVIIDGVKYQEKPAIKWYSYNHGNIIGYARDGDIAVHVIDGDTNRYLMFLEGFWDEMYVVYRTDKVIPEPSADIIDKILWYDYLDENNEEGYSYITEDKDTIKELFKALDTVKRTTEFNVIKKDLRGIDIGLACYSSSVPGLQYSLIVGISDGKIICGDRYEREYVELPLELMEKLAGKQIDNSGFTEG